MSQLQAQIADKPTLDKVDGNLGQRTDTPATAVNDTNSLLSVDKGIARTVGFMDAPAQASVGTTFSLMAYAKGILSLIGAATAAAGTGSVFARLRQIYEYLTTSGTIATQKLRIFDLLQSGMTQNTWYTVLNIAGGGFLYKWWFSAVGTGASYEVRVTVDGNASIISFPPGTLGAGSIRFNSGVNSLVRFSSSLIIEFRHIGASSTSGGIAGDYGLL